MAPNVMFFICAIIAVFTITPLYASPIPAPPKSTYSPSLRVFDLLPRTGPVSSISAGSPVQFNGSYPAQGTLNEQLGWFPNPVPPATTNTPISFIGFIQYNARQGIVFWVKRSLWQMYLKPLPESPETYAVMLGAIGLETKPVLSGNFTVTEVSSADNWPKFNFGWQGDVDNWFTCGGAVGSGEYYGLFYGKKIKGCSDKFQLEARYYQ